MIEDYEIDYSLDDDNYCDFEYDNFEDLEIICEFNGRQLTKAEARELFCR